MAKFNTGKQQTKVTSPVTADGSVGVNYNRALATGRDTKSELFLFAVSNFFGEASFYENDRARQQRFKNLSRSVAVEDPKWFTDFLRWLRRSAHIRTASLVAALEGIKGRLDWELEGHNRQFLNAVLVRGDEPGEAVAYWFKNYGRNLPMAIKRAVADWFEAHWDEFQYLKYGRKGTFSHVDLIRMTHPRLHKQYGLARFVLKDDKDFTPPMHALRAELNNTPTEDRVTLAMETIRKAGFTWEQYTGWLGRGLAEHDWEALIPNMGYMALLRNLRNFEEARVDPRPVVKRLTDTTEIARSKQLPLRFMSAYRAVHGFDYLKALEVGLDVAVHNIPILPGRTLILIDRSGSMNQQMSRHSDTTWMETAALFGVALAKRCMDSKVVEFSAPYQGGPANREVVFDKNFDPVLKTIKEQFKLYPWGTNTPQAIHDHLPNGSFDRMVILTDEQTSYHTHLPDDLPVYVWNFVGYKYGHDAAQDNVHVFGGLTDASFQLIPLLERGKNALWPWLTTSGNSVKMNPS
jgi:hypothetical protein